MTKLSEQDLQNVSGGVTRITQNDPNSNSGPASRPESDASAESDAK